MRPISDARELAADLHHGLKQAKATGDAEALSRVHELARQSGAAPEDLDEITGGFKTIARKLVTEPGRVRRNHLSWRRFSARRTLTRPGKPEPSELPPGRL